MIGKDQRGYVLSGLGFLLIIPIIILIPIALSVQQHSAEVPITFTRSDTLFNTFKAVQRDITTKTYDWGLEATNRTYKWNQHGLFVNNITRLHSNINETVYQQAYVPTVDTFDISPNYSLKLSMNNTTGIIPLRNGIILRYNLTGWGPVGSSIIYNYTLTTEINIRIVLTKANSGHNQTFNTMFDFPMFVNTTTNNATLAAIRINNFFGNVSSSLPSNIVFR